MKTSLYFVTLLVMLFSCSEPGKIVQEYQSIKDDTWAATNKLSFSFEITNKDKAHNLFYLARYNKEYPYYNFYVKRFMLDSNGKQLASTLQGMYLFDEKTGEPKGGGWGNNYDYAILADSNLHFPYNGKYSIEIHQYMRKDTIQGISDFGISISEHD
jgi:gliding motility-associated lipoprotein GldH